jgi:lysozyme
MTRSINSDGLEIIKSGEGLRLTAYLDPAGIWTIGYGHTPAHQGQVVTQDQADALLISDIAWASAAIDSATHDVSTTDNQFSAMVSLAFNIGAGAFKGSTVLRLHRAMKYQGAADAFLRWDKAHVDGVLVTLAGLAKRREQERELYLK